MLCFWHAYVGRCVVRRDCPFISCQKSVFLGVCIMELLTESHGARTSNVLLVEWVLCQGYWTILRARLSCFPCAICFGCGVGLSQVHALHLP